MSWVFWPIYPIPPFPSTPDPRSRVVNRKVVKSGNSRVRVCILVWPLPSYIHFYCRVTNHHTFSRWQQHTFVIPQFPWFRSLGSLSWVLCSGSQAVTQAPARALVPCEVQVPSHALVVIGRIHFLLAVEIPAACFFQASRRVSLRYLPD